MRRRRSIRLRRILFIIQENASEKALRAGPPCGGAEKAAGGSPPDT